MYYIHNYLTHTLASQYPCVHPQLYFQRFCSYILCSIYLHNHLTLTLAITVPLYTTSFIFGDFRLTFYVLFICRVHNHLTLTLASHYPSVRRQLYFRRFFGHFLNQQASILHLGLSK